MRSAGSAWWGLLSLVVAGCSETGPPAPLPIRLADTGLYVGSGSDAVCPDHLSYTPQYPLWSDGARKRRWIHVPEGAVIDASNPDAWEFPPGTKLWKEFAFDRRVETRYIERCGDGAWRYATYVWNEAGTDAVLAPEHGVRAAWCSSELRYDVPSRADCRACHEAGAGPVLGFSALQLSPDRDPLAPHAEAPRPGDVDLAELHQRGVLACLPPRLVLEPPRIAARSPRERAVLGYLHANCSSCHNRRGPLAELGLSLEWHSDCGAELPALHTACDQPSRYRSAGHGGDAGLRIASGAPSRSVLLLRVGSRDPLTQMPPLATRVVDEAALELLTGWVLEDLVTETTTSFTQR